jgi:hypothetical protein
MAFKIWTGQRWRYFATLQAATEAAGAIHRATGIIVAIEAAPISKARHIRA